MGGTQEKGGMGDQHRGIHPPRKVAVIGIGSNSTRMLLAKVGEMGMETLARFREGTRLFFGLREGVLSQESMERAAHAAGVFAAIARQEGCEVIHVLATSAARDAANGSDFCALVKSLCHAPLHILTGEREAWLSFLGAVGEGFSGVLDIGGGSVEIATGGGGRPFTGISLRLGASRLRGQVPALFGGGYERALTLAKGIIQAARGGLMPQLPSVWWGVGGTFTCLAAMNMGLPAFDREKVEGHVLPMERVRLWVETLSPMNEGERAVIPGITPGRADIIAHGAIALQALMETLGISRVIVSNRTNLDGYLKEIMGEEAP